MRRKKEGILEVENHVVHIYSRIKIQNNSPDFFLK